MTSFRPSCFRPRHWCSSLGTGSRNVTTYWNSSQSGRSSQRSTGNQLALFRWLSQARCLPGKSLQWCRESLGVCCLESSKIIQDHPKIEVWKCADAVKCSGSGRVSWEALWSRPLSNCFRHFQWVHSQICKATGVLANISESIGLSLDLLWVRANVIRARTFHAIAFFVQKHVHMWSTVVWTTRANAQMQGVMADFVCILMHAG